MLTARFFNSTVTKRPPGKTLNELRGNDKFYFKGSRSRNQIITQNSFSNRMFSKQMENRLKVESSGQTKTKTASTSPEGGFNKKRETQ